MMAVLTLTKHKTTEGALKEPIKVRLDPKHKFLRAPYLKALVQFLYTGFYSASSLKKETYDNTNEDCDFVNIIMFETGLFFRIPSLSEFAVAKFGQQHLPEFTPLCSMICWVYRTGVDSDEYSPIRKALLDIVTKKRSWYLGKDKVAEEFRAFISSHEGVAGRFWADVAKQLYHDRTGR